MAKPQSVHLWLDSRASAKRYRESKESNLAAMPLRPLAFPHHLFLYVKSLAKYFSKPFSTQ